MSLDLIEAKNKLTEIELQLLIEQGKIMNEQLSNNDKQMIDEKIYQMKAEKQKCLEVIETYYRMN